MQALKVLVVVMGLLIVAAVVIIVITIYSRASRMAAAPAAFEGAALPIPPGCGIGDMTGAEGRIWLRLEGGEACNRLFVLDAESGKLVGEIGAAP